MSEQVRHTDRCVAHNVQGKNSRILDSTGRRSIANAVIVSPPSQLRDTFYFFTYRSVVLRFFELLGVFIRFDEVEEINLEIMIPLGVLSRL